MCDSLGRFKLNLYDSGALIIVKKFRFNRNLNQDVNKMVNNFNGFAHFLSLLIYIIDLRSYSPSKINQYNNIVGDLKLGHRHPVCLMFASEKHTLLRTKLLICLLDYISCLFHTCLIK